VDRHDVGKPQLVAEYAATICKDLLRRERDQLAAVNYMSLQEDINEKMRAILVDWIIEVHLKFKLLPETLFVTVSLIDRYLGLVSVKRNNLQLVGVTAMFIASKYEEIYAPEVRDFVYITDNAYSKSEIFAMEHQILSTLNFSVTCCTPYRFLERFYKVANGQPRMWNLARYLIELPLIEQRMLKYAPSNVAASAIYLARIILQGNDVGWTQDLEKSSSYTETQLRPCAKDMCILLNGIEKCTLQAVRKKFSLQRYMEVALIKLESANADN
jgi:G2/mitotic-specific cyclin-B, other